VGSWSGWGVPPLERDSTWTSRRFSLTRSRQMATSGGLQGEPPANGGAEFRGLRPGDGGGACHGREAHASAAPGGPHAQERAHSRGSGPKSRVRPAMGVTGCASEGSDQDYAFGGPAMPDEREVRHTAAQVSSRPLFGTLREAFRMPPGPATSLKPPLERGFVLGALRWHPRLRI